MPGERATPPSATELDLEEAVDALLVVGPAPSPYLHYLDVDGLTASMGPGAEPPENRVGLVDLAPDAADAVIESVLARYRAAGRGARWYVSRRSRPVDLGLRLEAHGLRLDAASDLVGMSRPAAAGSSDLGPGRVRAVAIDEVRRHVSVMARGFGLSEERCLGILDAQAAGALGDAEFVHFLAYEDGDAVGFGSSLVDRARGVTLLGGSAVLPERRGRGHYRSLVHARVADAGRRGSAAVVTQALRRSSAPVLRRLGFESVLEFRAYDMAPPGP